MGVGHKHEVGGGHGVQQQHAKFTSDSKIYAEVIRIYSLVTCKLQVNRFYVAANEKEDMRTTATLLKSHV